MVLGRRGVDRSREPIQREDEWKLVSVVVAASRSRQQVVEDLCTQIRIDASESGEFVQAIQIGLWQHHSAGWKRWTARYLLGPPGVFPEPETASAGPRSR